MFKRFLRPSPVSRRTAWGLLLLRIAFGSALVAHGGDKILRPFDWMPPESNIPGVWQFLAVCGEFFGGGALLVGLPRRLPASAS